MPPLSKHEVGALKIYFKNGLTGTALLVVGNAALLYGWHIKNTTGAALYVQIFDAAAAGDVTLGTTAPTLSIGIEANGQTGLGLETPLKFEKGIVVASTTTVNGSTGAVSDTQLFYG